MIDHALQLSNNRNLLIYRVVYRYKWIPFIAFLSRLKLSMTGISCLTTPAILYFELYDKEFVESINLLLGCWGFSVATLFIVGEVFRRCLGILYINQDNSKVYIIQTPILVALYINFWPYCSPDSSIPIITLGKVGSSDILG